jgi:hypothetical protein
MEDGSVTSFLENVVKDRLDKKIIKLISDDVGQENMLEALLLAMEEKK